ncbi:energy-coupling factor transporter transmembrane protein EcfT [Peptoniphilus sp. GNH]|nr:cobalt transport protein [Clostridiales bacterium KA00134]UHR02712.1 energy-coupling factor transporter transmembrane protein EcfT [Peptoniphilus sp. GNH]
MLKDITIGQYFPSNSIVHKFDPRMKIIVMLIFIISLFFIDSFVPYILVLAYLILVIKTSHLPFSMVIRGIKPLRWIILLTFLINVFFTGGREIFSIWRLHVTYEGLYQAFFMAIRLVFLVVGTSLLTLTTSPIELTDGLESLLMPFKKIGMPAHELAMMMTIALRFIPTLIEETDKITKAQMARGADFESGNILKRARSLVPLLVPLFLNGIQRATELATAMESRCYRGGEGRTKLNELSLKKKDYFLFFGNCAFYALIIVWRFVF